jgi:hypothetical protein
MLRCRNIHQPEFGLQAIGRPPFSCFAKLLSLAALGLDFCRNCCLPCLKSPFALLRLFASLPFYYARTSKKYALGGKQNMNKISALLFAVVTIVWMCATAISINYNVWLAIFFALLMFATMALGFIVKARVLRRKKGDAN